jgi:hypothetical protein
MAEDDDGSEGQGGHGVGQEDRGETVGRVGTRPPRTGLFP